MTPSDDKVDVEGLIAEGPKEWKWHAYHGVICQQAEEIERLRRSMRYNVRPTPSGIAVCFGEHDRGTACDEVNYVPKEMLDALTRQLQEAVEESGKQQDALDLMRDEFIRIKAITSSAETEGICDRAMSSIERTVPLVLHFEEVRRQLRDTEFLYHAYFVLCKEAGISPGSRELMEAADRFNAALTGSKS